jgi:hypothetical protein
MQQVTDVLVLIKDARIDDILKAKKRKVKIIQHLKITTSIIN